MNFKSFFIIASIGLFSPIIVTIFYNLFLIEYNEITFIVAFLPSIVLFSVLIIDVKLESKRNIITKLTDSEGEKNV